MRNTRKFSKLTGMMCLVPLAVSVLLSGCATDDTIPISKEADKQEYDQVTAYAAELLLKYSYNLVDDLTFVEIPKDQKLEQTDNAADSNSVSMNAFSNIGISTKDEQAAVPQPSNPDASETASSQIDVAAGNNEHTSGAGASVPSDASNVTSSQPQDTQTDAPGASATTEATAEPAPAPTETTEPENSGTAATTPQETPQEAPQPTDTLDSISNAVGVDLVFNGYSVMNQYSNGTGQGLVDASAGKKLLVLNMLLYNSSSSGKQVNLISSANNFKVYINGSDVGYTKRTMLDNDLSNYVGTVAAGERVPVVLIVEIPADKASNISTLTLTSTIGGVPYSVSLD